VAITTKRPEKSGRAITKEVPRKTSHQDLWLYDTRSIDYIYNTKQRFENFHTFTKDKAGSLIIGGGLIKPIGNGLIKVEAL
jgi:hypothetical protein